MLNSAMIAPPRNQVSPSGRQPLCYTLLPSHCWRQIVWVTDVRQVACQAGTPLSAASPGQMTTPRCSGRPARTPRPWQDACGDDRQQRVWHCRRCWLAAAAGYIATLWSRQFIVGRADHYRSGLWHVRGTKCRYFMCSVSWEVLERGLKNAGMPINWLCSTEVSSVWLDSDLFLRDSDLALAHVWNCRWLNSTQFNL